jgi:3-oxoacyl-[acyl-carrier-protein] synthase-3
MARPVFKVAVGVMAEVGAEALKANGVDASAVDWLIPHQANIRIMDASAKKLGVPSERMIATVDRHANTVGRFDPAGARRGGPRRPHQGRPSSAPDRRRRRVHLGVGLPHLVTRKS